VPEYIRTHLQMLGAMWSALKQSEALLTPEQIKLLWRALDHHEWWEIVDLFEKHAHRARSIGYLVTVIADDTNYHAYARDPRSYARDIFAHSRRNFKQKKDIVHDHTEHDDALPVRRTHTTTRISTAMDHLLSARRT
jgi:hypothetical protein